MKYRHLKSLVNLYENEGGNKQIDHLAYRIYYFIPYEKEDFEKPALKEIKIPEKVTELFKGSNDFKGILETRREALATLAPLEEIRIGEMKLLSRLVHGLGAAHVQEVSMTIHPVYGIPYIPASSVKGLVRHWFLQAFFEGKEPDHPSKQSGEKKELSLLYRELFGGQGNDQEMEIEESENLKGLATFYDLFIIDGKITPDVLTVHFRDYYSSTGSKPVAPNMDQNPIPVSFYTVTGGKTEIIISISKDNRRKRFTSYSPEQLADLLLEWTSTALWEWGIGSKTALNYGRFTEFENHTSKLNEIRKKKEENRKRETEEREKEAEAKRLAEMTEEERLIYAISKLSPTNEEDRTKSKGKIYAEILRLGSSKAASRLKDYWQQSGDWGGKGSSISKKQKEKVTKILDILNRG